MTDPGHNNATVNRTTNQMYLSGPKKKTTYKHQQASGIKPGRLVRQVHMHTCSPGNGFGGNDGFSV
jgi:hypothetical protein